MTKTFCDYCGKEVDIKETIVADLDNDSMVYIEIKPTKLARTKDGIINPDLCSSCIIKAIQERH